MNATMMQAMIKMLGINPDELIVQGEQAVRQLQGYGIHFASQLNRIEANQHEIMSHLGISDKIAAKPQVINSETQEG